MGIVSLYNNIWSNHKLLRIFFCNLLLGGLLSNVSMASDQLIVKKDYLKEIAPLSKVYFKGDKGKEVLLIQEWLMLWQLNDNFVDIIIKHDGIFCSDTETLVKEIQKFLAIEPNGKVDSKTWNGLIAPMKKAFSTESYKYKSLREKVKYFASKHMQYHSAELDEDNIGPWVRSYMGGKDGKLEYWCQGFTGTILDQAFSSIGKKFTDYYLNTTACELFREYALKRGLLVKVEQLKKKEYIPKVGDIVLYLNPKETHAHHTEIIYEILDEERGTIRTIGGNTNFAGGRNGVGVYLVDRNYLIDNIEVVKLVDEKIVQKHERYPEGVRKLIVSYPEHIVGYKNNKLIFADNTVLLYDDYKKKSWSELLTNADIKDQFYYSYLIGKYIPQKPFIDPGRITNEEFFKKIYGATEEEVINNLVEIIWLPSFNGGKKIKVTTINGVDQKIINISAELEKHPELKSYITNIGGAYKWRKISGTKRLSLHSFGIAIDINVQKSNYWQWDCKCKNEDNMKLKYVNRIPQLIVDIFEKHGFIWGGKWYHYDTMHFEYRPELLIDR